MTETKSYPTFSEFYPFYLSEHKNPQSRKLHFIGASIAILLLVAAIVTLTWWLVPRFSFMGDGRMWWEVLTGKVRFSDQGVPDTSAEVNRGRQGRLGQPPKQAVAADGHA